MKSFHAILIIGLLFCFFPVASQECAPSVTRWFRDLHVRCEKAYEYNNYAAMETSLEERRKAILAGRLAGLSKEDSVEVLGMYHKDWGSYYACMAYIEGGSYIQAKECYEKSIEVFKDDVLSLSVVRTELAQIHYRCKEYQDALELLGQNYTLYSRQFISEALVTFSQMALCKARLNLFDEAVSDIDKALELCIHDRRLINDSDHMILELKRKKGKILLLRAEAYGTSSDEALECFREYFSYAKSSVLEDFSQMDADERERYWLRMHPFIADCYRLEDNDPSLLYDVTLFSKSLLLQFSRQKDGYVTVDYSDVQEALGADECAIEFIRYELGERVRYGALVLKSEGSPDFIRIGSEEEILQHKIYGWTTVEKAIGVNAKPQYRDSLYVCKSLSRIIWNDGLRSKLSDVRKVYFSPDGLFHQIAIEYMYPEVSPLSFYRLTSTKEILRGSISLRTDKMLLCGGVDYFKAHEEDFGRDNDTLAFQLLRKRRLRFKALDGSMAEVDSIYRLRNEEKDSLVVGQAVTESACSRLMGQYPIVLLSTHGYFSGGADFFGEELKPRTSDHTMSESVLILASCQSNLDDYSFDPSETDGVLSARELSAMDLEDVDLFIVAACQSGLGCVTPEGVYGIQRGLKNAGVRAMIVSLWNVGDDATRHFMINLNKALQLEGDLQSAFEYARACMDDEVQYSRPEFEYRRDVGHFFIKEGGQFPNPNYKNAFILIDNL